MLSGLPRVGDSPWVIVGSEPERHLAQLQPAWKRVRKRAGLEDVRIHDLQASFKSSDKVGCVPLRTLTGVAVSTVLPSPSHLSRGPGQ